MRFLAELKRRNVFRMAGLYLVSAWLVVQVAETLLPIFHTPDWVLQSIVVLLALGLVPALIVSWIYELTPEGLRREDELGGAADPGYRGPERRLRRIADQALPAVHPDPYQRKRQQDRLIMGLLLLAVGYFVVDKFWWGRSTPAMVAESVAPALLGPAGTAAQISANLIAVLPFRNRSVLPEDAFLAEGLHDDLLTQLAKVSGLQVISRTSMMRYADSRLSVPEIARELGAAVVVEGGVQRSGDRVLITVQLIKGATDVHLWAERYDRQLSTGTIFAIQAEIAQAVAAATSSALSEAEASALATGSTQNLKAYEAFLQAKLLSANDLATPERFASALVQYDRAIALDPDFAEAHARKARIQFALYWYGYADESMREAAKATTARAIALAPDDIETWMAQAYLHYWGELDYERAEAMLGRVIARVPGHAEAWYARGLVARRDGRFQDTIEAFRRSLEFDPANTDTLLELSNTLLTLGEFEASEIPRQRAKELGVDLQTHAAEEALNRGKVEVAWAAIAGPNDFYVALPFRIALASRDPARIEKALSAELWPERLRQFPKYPDVYALARAEGLLATGQTEAAQRALGQIRDRLAALDNPYPGGWSSTGFYFYYPCDLPGMLGDLEGVLAAEQDWVEQAPRDVWSEGGVRQALAVAYVRAGDAERALDHLERVMALFGPVAFMSMANSPALDPLHLHPRYLAMAEAHRRWEQQGKASKRELVGDGG